MQYLTSDGCHRESESPFPLTKDHTCSFTQELMAAFTSMADNRIIFTLLPATIPEPFLRAAPQALHLLGRYSLDEYLTLDPYLADADLPH